MQPEKQGRGRRRWSAFASFETEMSRMCEWRILGGKFHGSIGGEGHLPIQSASSPAPEISG